MSQFLSATTILFAVIVGSVLSLAQPVGTVPINDNSDWWSIIRNDSTDKGLKPQRRNVDESNFHILGVVVGSDELEGIQRKLGTAYVIGRGDASNRRSQICYAGIDGKTYLTFESGEVQYAFYVFTGGPNWSGRDHCAKSKLITPSVKTGSGLHLGQSLDEVKSILGEPTRIRKNSDLVYFRQIRKKSSIEDLRKAREQYPKMSETELHENYGYYYASFYIVAKFASSELVYMGLSKSDTY